MQQKRGAFLQNLVWIATLNKCVQKSVRLLINLDTDINAYHPDCSVFYTGATQIEQNRKNIFEDFGGFPGQTII